MGPRRLLAILLVLLQYNGAIAGVKCGDKCDKAKVIPAECKPSDGCQLGGSLDKVPGATPGCSIMKCKDPADILRIPEFPGLVFTEITCNDKKDWVVDDSGETIAKAVCIKKFECHKKGKPTASCTHADYQIKDCLPGDQPKFTDDNEKTCAGKTMFYLPASPKPGTDWAELPDNKITCDTSSGMYKSGQADLSTNDHVICLNTKPVKVCPFLTSNCKDVNIKNKKAQCEEINQPTDGTNKVGCNSVPVSRKVYTFDAQQNKFVVAEPMMCVTSKGWKQGGSYADPVPNMVNFICAAEDPNIFSCDFNLLTSNCDEVNQLPNKLEVDCEKITERSDGVAECDVTTRHLMRQFTQATTSWDNAIAIKDITCDTSDGKWKLEGAPFTMAAGDNLICAKKDPSQSCVQNTALNLAASDYKKFQDDASEVRFEDDGKLECKSPEDLYFKTASGTAWQRDKEIRCNAKTAQYIDASLGVETQPGDEVICSKTLPQLKVSCKDKNPLNTVDPCLQVDSSIDCKPADPEDSFFHCPAGETQYIKESSGKWRNVKFIFCNPKNGDWLELTRSGPEMKATEVICATKDPEACPLLKSECHSMKGCTTADLLAPSCDSSVGALYYKEGAGDWKPATQFVCDNRVWKEGAQSTDTKATDVICSENKPCPVLTSREAECHAFHECTAPADLTAPTCGSEEELYYKDTTGTWAVAKNMQCDTTGAWQQGDPTLGNMDATTKDVVCAKVDPNQKPGTCVPLNLDCNGLPDCTPLVVPTCTAPNPCEIVPTCPSGNLYFKVDAGDKFMKAESVKCHYTDKWELQYTYGSKQTEKLVDIVHVICATKNPDADACIFTNNIPIDLKIFDKKFIPTKFEAGQEADCGSGDGDGFVTEKDPVYLVKGTKPVCSPNGHWISPDDDEDYEKIMCAQQRCTKCSTDLPRAVFNYGHFPYDATTSIVSDCSAYECPFAHPLVVKTMAGGEYFMKRLHCSNDIKWQLDNMDEAESVACRQTWPCLNNWKDNIGTDVVSTFQQVKLECPTTEEAKAAKCEPAIRLPSSNPSEPDEKLKCVNNLKMFMMKGSKPWWYPISLTEIACDTNTGTWKIGSGDRDIIDHDHTIFCAEENTMPEPTTTTTTTTTEAPKPICELCKTLPKFDDCDSCLTDGNSTVKLEPQGADKCRLTLAVKDYILLFSQTVQHELICKRRKPGDERDEVWKTGEEQEVTIITVRQELKKESWKVASYCVVGGVFLAIGGMAIGCIVIYMRMRKKPSQRENKKKERGVTKKYTASASNVQKGGRSTGGTSEAGQSKERAVSSKMEENLEDAPTLKI